MLPSGSQRHQVSSSMVGKTWSYVSYSWFLAYEILSIIRSQIEIERIFSLVGILTNLKRCCLQSKKKKKLIFVSKNWPSDLRNGCKPPSNLVELIQTDLGFEEELEEFEGSFEWDEIVDI